MFENEWKFYNTKIIQINYPASDDFFIELPTLKLGF